MTKPHYAWVILAVGTLVVFGALGLARFGYSVILPSMQAGLGLSNTQAGALVSANLLGYVILSVVGGALASRYGPRAVISIGLALGGLGMLLTGLVGGFASAMLWRGLTGVGSGASNVPVMGLVTAWFASRRRGLAAGIAVGGSSIGLIVAGPLVPRILSVYGEAGWRVSWFLFGGVTIALGLLSFAALRNRPAEMGLTPAGAAADAVAGGPASGGGGLQWGSVYRSMTVWHLGFVYIAFGFSYIIYMTFFTKYLIAEQAYSKESAGGMFMIMGWFSLFSGLVWGTVSDSIGRKRALILVYLVHTIAFALFGLWTAPVGLLLSTMLFGSAAWSIPAIMSATCGDLLGPKMAPAALGFITMFFGLGQAIGPSVAGAVADATGTFAPAFVLAAIVALIGAGGAWLLRPASAAVSA
ncbi:MAG: YbfB/YjiJ family MFS transporter [Chloroflexi bacterium]|nr:YbfB/YjiJ family MFS transporter [Chloroflexota bacterium]